jgi:hypothetical protein
MRMGYDDYMVFEFDLYAMFGVVIGDYDLRLYESKILRINTVFVALTAP